MESPSVNDPQEPMHAAIDEADQDVARMPRSRHWVTVFLVSAFGAALVYLGTWCTYWADVRSDQYQLINLGQCVYDGGRLYIDCWENKPPGIAWLNTGGIALGGGEQIGAWVLPGLIALLCLGVMGVAMTRVLSRAAGCLTVLLAAVTGTLRVYDTPSINPDFYSSMFELAACSLWLISLNPTGKGCRVWAGLVAGLVWAAAVAVKQTGVVGLLAVSVVAIALLVLKQGEHRRLPAACGFAWIGFLLGTGGVVGVLAYRGTLGPAWEAVFVFNSGLLNWESISGAVGSWSRARAGLEPLQLPLWLGLVGIIATLRTAKASRLSIAFVTAMLLWWIVQVLLALIGPSRSMRYWQATFPAMLWLAAVGIYYLEAMFRKLGTGHRAVFGVVLATVVLLLGRPLAEHYTHGVARSYLAYSSETTERDRLAALGRGIQTLVPRGRAIYVWAYDPGVYLYAHRKQASRFTYPRSAAQMDEILSDLATGKAGAVLIPENDSAEFDRWCDDSCYRRLGQILSGYQVKPAIGRYRTWVRTPGDEEKRLSN